MLTSSTTNLRAAAARAYMHPPEDTVPSQLAGVQSLPHDGLLRHSCSRHKDQFIAPVELISQRPRTAGSTLHPTTRHQSPQLSMLLRRGCSLRPLPTITGDLAIQAHRAFVFVRQQAAAIPWGVGSGGRTRLQWSQIRRAAPRTPTLNTCIHKKETAHRQQLHR